MPIKILMPALSPTMTEGNLAKWLIGEGDAIRAGDAIAEIETDKATMEVEAVDDGILGKILVPDGTEGVAVNQVIGIVLEDGEDASALESVATDETPAPPAASAPPTASAAPATPPSPSPAPSINGDFRVTPLARRVAQQMSVDLASVTATGPGGVITLGDVEAAAGGATKSIPPVSTSVSTPAVIGGDRIFASPLARRMASQAGLDLSAIAGSGPDGRIVKSDIDAAQAAGTAAAASAPAPTAPIATTPAPSTPPPTAAAEDQDVKLSTMRRVIAERMIESKTQVPHFYLTMDCEIDELLKIRSRLNKQAEPDKISVNDFVIRACGLALREVPEANVSWLGDGMMRQFGAVDISVAVAIDGGLITPIVRNADRKGFVEISRDMKDLAARARDGKLTPEEYQGGSFSISNLGMFGVKQFDAVINPPQACILAVGAGEQRPVVRDGEIVVAAVMSCTLSVDHRVVDGAIGARLLAAIKRFIEFPPAMLL
jgi:pyruvate dehydrogenase E2 component (dihydrolipoamide acetyltransferase)